jgi:hypothetical protein
LLWWDTGASGSVVYKEDKNKIFGKRFAGIMRITDMYSTSRFSPMYRSTEFNMTDDLSIHNFIFGVVKGTSDGIKFGDKIGIMGMDVISTANWLVDFQLNKVDVFPQSKVYETETPPQLVFKYEQKRKPKTHLEFSVGKFENVLIDAGANHEMALLKPDLEKINKKYKPVDTLTSGFFGLFSATPTTKTVYVYDSIKINDVYFHNIRITEHSKERIVGISFFRRFEKVFLNTKERQFYFYGLADNELRIVNKGCKKCCPNCNTATLQTL